MEGVGVVIPAYNEAERIERVLKVVLETACVNEVVVVDDGSEDGTSDIVVNYIHDGGVKLVRLPTNRGKAMAVWVGICRITNPVVVLLDADLIGLRSRHIELLAMPIICGNADMTIGIFRKGRLATDWSHRIAPSISGQRGIRKELLLKLPSPNGLGYGLEAFLNQWAKRYGWNVRHVILEGVSHVTKEEKLGLLRAIIARSRMYWDIGRALKDWLMTNGDSGRD